MNYWRYRWCSEDKSCFIDPWLFLFSHHQVKTSLRQTFSYVLWSGEQVWFSSFFRLLHNQTCSNCRSMSHCQLKRTHHNTVHICTGSLWLLTHLPTVVSLRSPSHLIILLQVCSLWRSLRSASEQHLAAPQSKTSQAKISSSLVPWGGVNQQPYPQPLENRILLQLPTHFSSLVNFSPSGSYAREIVKTSHIRFGIIWQITETNHVPPPATIYFSNANLLSESSSWPPYLLLALSKCKCQNVNFDLLCSLSVARY